MMNQLAAQRRATVIDDRTRYIAAHLVRIDVGVEERIGERHEDDEDEDTLIPQYRAALVIPYIEKVFHDFSVLLYVFEFEESFMITRQYDDWQQSKAYHHHNRRPHIMDRISVECTVDIDEIIVAQWEPCGKES